MALTNNCTAYYSNSSLLKSNFQKPSLDNFRKYLTGVHVTDYFPKGGVLKAAYNKGMSMRPTVHFSLGQMVISHALGQWEKKKYAVLTPFSQMEKQLLNVFHQDTFVLGDLKLEKGSIIIVPEGETINSPTGNLEIIRYNPEKISLRDKVNETLQKQDQWIFKATGGNSYDKVFLYEKELNQKDFFNAILTKYPHVTFGLHHSHTTGQIDHFISENLGIFRDPSASTERSYLDWILKLEKLKFYLSQTDLLAKKFHHIPEAYDTYLLAKKRFESKINILQIEIDLQRNYRKTPLGSSNLSKDFLDQIILTSPDKKKLSHFLKLNLDTLKTFDFDINDAQREVYSSYELLELREDLSVKNFSEFLNSHPDILEAAEGLDFQLALKSQ